MPSIQSIERAIEQLPAHELAEFRQWFAKFDESVGLMLVLMGWAAFLASPVSLGGVVAFIAYITRFQIKPEERILLEKFGEEYRTYILGRRRWI